MTPYEPEGLPEVSDTYGAAETVNDPDSQCGGGLPSYCGSLGGGNARKGIPGKVTSLG